MTDVARWLESIGLGKYAELFAENDIDLEVLPELADSDLEKLGISLGHRKKLLKAIRELDGDTSAPDEQSPPASERKSDRPADAERRQLSVMFCDLVGSTELSQRVDAEDLHDLMRRYQDAVAGVVARYEGHVAKFLGDGVCAYFGWPRAYEDQAARAVRSGLAAVEAVGKLTTNDGQALSARVGIATGQVVIGDMIGEAATEEDAVVGETPNLAARLQVAASPGQVVIGSNTRQLIGNAFDLTDLGSHELKGIGGLVDIWIAVGERAAEGRFEAAHPGGRSAFVGRAPELALLRRGWEQSRKGVGQVVLVSGEPGIGKSRLVDAFNATLEDESYTRITLRCSPYHTNSALYPLIVQLERVFGWEREDSAEEKLAKLEGSLKAYSQSLDEVIPLFASLLSLPLPDDRFSTTNLTPQQQKQQTLDALTDWLLEETEQRPVLTVWEDLHWADPSTIELLGLVIEQTPTAPILNVLTFRPAFTPPWPQRTHMTPVTLSRLERPEVETLIGQHTEGKSLPSEVVEHIVEKTDGVPLYVEELTKAILEADFLREHAGRYELTGPMSGITIPATLQDSLMARLDRLPNIREVAQLGAVFGREFVYEMVEAIASIDETSLQNGLDQLVASELLYQRGRPPRAKYIFKHALVQDAAYHSLLRRTRQYYHGQVAELLESRFPETAQIQPELVAHHYTEADLPEQAVEYWHKAGQLAAQRSADLEAVGHLRKGLELLARQSQSVERDRKEFKLLTGLGPVLMATKGYAAPETIEAYGRARELCEEVGRTDELVPVLFGLWLNQAASGEHRAALSDTQKLLVLAESLGEPSYLLWGHLAHGVESLFVGDLTNSREHLEEVVRLYEPAEHAALALRYSGIDAGAAALSFLGWTLWLLGDVEQAVARANEARDHIRQLDIRFTLGRSLYWDAILRQFVGDWGAVRERAQEAVTMATEHGLALVLAAGKIMLGWSRIHEGESAEGEAQVREGIAAHRATGANLYMPYFLSSLAEAARGEGQPEEGLEVLSDAIAQVESGGERYFEAELHRLRGECLLERSPDDHGPADDALQTALTVARAQEAKSLELRAAMSLARLRQSQGKIQEARDLLAPVYSWFTEGFDTADLKEAKALSEELG